MSRNGPAQLRASSNGATGKRAATGAAMDSGIIFADEWQGLLAPFVLVLLVAVLLVSLALGVGLGLAVAFFLRLVALRNTRRVDAALRRLGRAAVWACGGLLLGLALAWLFWGDRYAGPMITPKLTERAAFTLCFFVPLGVGAGVAAGIARR
jgi:hypothetical protein